MIISRKTALSVILLFAGLQTLNANPAGQSDQYTLLELGSTLGGDPPSSREGYFTLEWELDEQLKLIRPRDSSYPDRLILIESKSSEFTEPTVFHDDQEMSIAMSGKVDGDLYYRLFLLRSKDKLTAEGPPTDSLPAGVSSILGAYDQYDVKGYSNVYHIEVKHYSLQTAFLYFGIGAFLFLVTSAVIIIGTYRNTREQKGAE